MSVFFRLHQDKNEELNDHRYLFKPRITRIKRIDLFTTTD